MAAPSLEHYLQNIADTIRSVRNETSDNKINAAHFTEYISEMVPKKYTVTLTANPTEGGTVSGAGEYISFSYANISATANPNYEFTGWNDGNTDATRNIYINKSNLSYTAQFKQSIINIFTPDYVSSIHSNYPMVYVSETQECDAAGMAGSANWFINITPSHSTIRQAKYGIASNLYTEDTSTGYCTNCDWGVVNSSWGYRMPQNFTYNEKYIQIDFNVIINKDFKLHLYNMDYVEGDYNNYLGDSLFHGFIIKVSTDGTNFHEADAQIEGDIDKSARAENIYDVTNSENVTSIRICGDIEENWCGTWFSLAHIKLFTSIS